jgi:hypothetical protein
MNIFFRIFLKLKYLGFGFSACFFDGIGYGDGSKPKRNRLVLFSQPYLYQTFQLMSS